MEYHFSDEERQRWNDILLGCFDRFVALCEEYGLTYYCVGGTVIGAIRHQGMIPWDDDIDVAMPRPDYDRFVEICRTHPMDDYELATPEMKGYPYFFAKFCDRNTTLIELENVPCMHGIYIDIFPMDGTAADADEAKKLMCRFKRWSNKINACLAHLSLSEYLSLFTQPKEYGRALVQTLSFIVGRERMRRYFISRLDNIARAHDYQSAKRIANYGGAWAAKEIYPAEWLTPCAKASFEGREVNIPGKYDAYLTQMYGNYMQLPPKEKQMSHHHHAFVDLYKRVEK